VIRAGVFFCVAVSPGERPSFCRAPLFFSRNFCYDEGQIHHYKAAKPIPACRRKEYFYE
jgi:hypothetical protein